MDFQSEVLPMEKGKHGRMNPEKKIISIEIYFLEYISL